MGVTQYRPPDRYPGAAIGKRNDYFSFGAGEILFLPLETAPPQPQVGPTLQEHTRASVSSIHDMVIAG